jgi:chorismate synthase
MSNTFNKIFKVTTFGESHGKAIGAVIDGCPSNIEITENDINNELKRRRPFNNKYTSQREEEDKAKILSGVYKNKTLGSPICVIVENKNFSSKEYLKTKDILKPSHANYTYMQKYGLFDPRGSSRASGRETIARVIASAIAKKILDHYKIKTIAYIKQIKNIKANIDHSDYSSLKENTYNSPIYCPDIKASKKMESLLDKTIKEKDSIGGVVEFAAYNMPTSLGEPIYDKLDARLGSAMLSIGGSKGFEIGKGFESSKMRGSEYNDLYIFENSRIKTKTNNSGGILAGISTSELLIGTVAFKPTPSILKPQKSINLQNKSAVLALDKSSKHDPCIAIRASVVVEAMLNLTLVDFILLNKLSAL